MDAIWMSKKLVFGLTLSVSISFFPLQAQTLSWPPDEKGLLEQSPLVTLLGPVYESDLEIKQPWHRTLLDTLGMLSKNPRHLPDFYLGRIRELRHFLFHPGYKNDEEWGSIKTLLQGDVKDSKRKTVITERIAGILEVNINRPEGLELAIRVIPPDAKSPNRFTLEGYRFIKQPTGKGEVEWYNIRVPLSGRDPKNVMKDAIIWLLLKPFSTQGKRYIVEDQTIPFWQDTRTPGLLKYSQNTIQVDSTPVLSEFVRGCPRIACPNLGTKKKYATATSLQQAEKFCESLGRELVTEPTLLLLHQLPKTRSMLAEGEYAWGRSGGDVWGRGSSKPVKFEMAYQHHDLLRKQDTGIVWCQPIQQEPRLTFTERPNQFVLEKLGLYLVWHQRSGNSHSGDLYQLEGETITTLLEADPEHPTVRRSWILRNPLAVGVDENSTVRVRAYDDSYNGMLLQVYPATLTLRTEHSIYQHRIVMRKMGLVRGNWYRRWVGSLGYTTPMFKSLELRSMKESTELIIDWGAFAEAGFDRPLRLIPGIRWGGYAGVNGFFYFGSTVPLVVFNLEARAHYRIWENLNLFGGVFFGSGTNKTPDSYITELGITASSLSTGLHWSW